MPDNVLVSTSDCRRWFKTLADSSVDLILTSPPYFVGKEYDKSSKAADFLPEIARLIPEIKRVLKPGGSMCWQTGYHAQNNTILPLDFYVHQLFVSEEEFQLRNRIIWTFGHGVHCKNRFSGRHETIMWYSRGEQFAFDLDAVRVAQKYPGKTHYKGDKKGTWSGNPLGKNPSDVWVEPSTDVWDIPNVKAGHVEKTEHPCQFPVALAARLIRALTPSGGLVIDPFMGSGSTAVASAIEGRAFRGCDTSKRYVDIAKQRLRHFDDGLLKVRADAPVFVPTGKESVSKVPPHFAHALIGGANDFEADQSEDQKGSRQKICEGDIV